MNSTDKKVQIQSLQSVNLDWVPDYQKKLEYENNMRRNEATSRGQYNHKIRNLAKPPSEVAAVEATLGTNLANSRNSDLRRNEHGSEKEEAKESVVIGPFVAMDCEMVGTGLNGCNSELARVSIVNGNGEVVLDEFVNPRGYITDYRTRWSGITPRLIRKYGKPFEEIQQKVYDIIKNRIVIGHALQNDFSVLFLDHPRSAIRDTSKYKPLSMMVGGGTPSLKRLATEILGIDIQSGAHSSVEDSRACMALYKLYRNYWEDEVKSYNHHGKRRHRR